jgi:hypothetical protein
LEKRKRNSTGKKKITPRRSTGMNISDAGKPELFSTVLNAVRKVPAMIPIMIARPRKIKLIIARNIAHFLAVLR